MDITWVTDRIALGGGIWNARNMEELVQVGVTHVLNMQQEFDDRTLGMAFGVEVLWNPTDDDFRPKSPQLLRMGCDFALQALDKPGSKIFVHCAAGVHRAPMMTLAIMCALGWPIDEAIEILEVKRPVVDFVDVYVESVRRFNGLEK